MPTQFWLVKSEPSTYSWDDFVKEQRCRWDGVRNFQARANLRAMKESDLVLFYHSGDGKDIRGVAKVVREAYPDPTAKGEAASQGWAAVDLEPVCPLVEPVTLAQLKQGPTFEGLALLRQGRLSVVPVSPAHFSAVLKLAKTRLSRSSRGAG